MRGIVLVFVVVVFAQLCCHSQAAPHKSDEDEDSDEMTSSEHDVEPDSVHPLPATSVPEPVWHQVQSHEVKSRQHNDQDEDDEEERSSEEAAVRDVNYSDEEEEPVKFPKTESLCPARPEEIMNIEAACAKEFQLWKESRAKKAEQALMTTTLNPLPAPVLDVEILNTTAVELSNSSVEDVQMTTLEVNLSAEETSTTEGGEMEAETEEATTTEMMTTSTSTTTTTMMTTTRPIRRNSKHKRSTKIIKKRSCFPATCILKKLNLVDSMGQPSVKSIQSFVVNMTVDGSTNLEAKAVGCVKEINDAMVHATGDIGKKVGCVAQKVISCLNKGLACPIMKVPQ